jgi:hypothetical protein
MHRPLVQTLTDAGKPTCEFLTGDGSELLILPHGGRVLGLFAPGSAENFFWSHPCLEQSSSAAEFYAGSEWHNSGGDRLWLAPEVDFFFPNYPSTDVYFQPRQLDPGQWQLTRETETVSLVNRLTCRLTRSKADVEMELRRVLGAAANPLRHESCFSRLSKVEYAGYRLTSSIDLLSGEQRVGLWNLVQMPHGGDLLVPTYGRSEPKLFFGSPPPGDVETRDGLVLFHMRAQGEFKFAVRAAAATGRVGYRYRTSSGKWALLIRNACIDPSGDYEDVPWTEPDDRGYAIQICNVNSALGSFAEMEYHVPAVGPGTGRNRCADVCQTWAFRGSREEIDEIVSCLLIREQ